MNVNKIIIIDNKGKIIDNNIKVEIITISASKCKTHLVIL